MEDPRTSNATRHNFVEMLMIAVFSSLCGGQTCVDMADYAKNNEGFLRQFMRLEHGVPSHDSFSRIFRMIDPVPFAAARARFASDWAKILEAEGVQQIAIDGKVLRRTFSRAEELSPLHLSSAFAPGAGLVLGQAAVDEKSNEIRALPALLEMLDIKGTVVTADAMHTQRTATVSHDIGPLQDAHRWPRLAAVGKVESVRVSDGLTRYYIMSRKMSPRDFLKAVRNHWAIKIQLHWVLDVQMREDDLRNRAGHGPENLAGILRLVVNIVRLKKGKLSFRRRLLRAAQVREYRLEFIASAAKLAEAL